MKKELKQRWNLISATLDIAGYKLPANIYKQLRKKMDKLLFVIENRDMSNGTRWEKTCDELTAISDKLREQRLKYQEVMNDR